jgi:hypothetical protein
MFIVVAMMTASACSDPVDTTTIKSSGTSSNQNPNREYHTAVTTWSPGSGSSFVGLVSAVPNLDLSRARISIVSNGIKTSVESTFNVSSLQTAHRANQGYIWASFQNNILLLNYIGQTPTSLPPFPLEVIIVY